MRITVLGTGTIAHSPTRSCSAYHVDLGDARVLMDCGPGTCRRLAQYGLDWQALTHVVLSHFHIDHHLDLPALLFAWKYGQLPRRTAAIEIIGPVGTRSLLEKLAGVHGEWVTNPGYPVNITELVPGTSAVIADAKLDCVKVPHTAESMAYSLSRNGRRIVYSGDTGYNTALADWAKDCDVLILECSLPASMAIVEHLTPEQCADMAGRATPKQLVLTHMYPPVESVDIRSIIAERFGGPLVLAHDGWTFELRD